MKSKITTKPAENADESQSDWVKTPVKYKPSGVYFARVRIRGKLYRASLKTTVMSVAKVKLCDYVKEIRQAAPDAEILGRMTMGDAIDVLLARLKANQEIKGIDKIIPAQMSKYIGPDMARL